MGIQRKMRTVLLVVALGCAAFASQEVEDEFSNFKAKFNKVYASPEEERMRFKIFEENYWSTKGEQKMLKSYTTGVTQFSDLTHQEFKDNYLGLKRHSVPSGRLGGGPPVLPRICRTLSTGLRRGPCAR